jgi:autotransporter adhesin
MATTYLIVGESGTGKSTSLGKVDSLGLIGLDPKETAIINVMDKPLPFKGSKAQYGNLISAGGNYAAVSDGVIILKILASLKERQDIKNIVIDDFQYIMAEEFMAKALKKGYDKFNEIGKHAYDVITQGKNLRPDQNFICLTHSDFDDKAGTYKLKTIGKMLDDKVNLAGLFTVILYTQVDAVTKDGETKVTYNFVTNKYSNNAGIEIPAKSPIGMFDELLIPNDLGLVVQKASEYYG